MADQTNQIQLYGDNMHEDYTPSGSDITGGVPLDLGGRAAVAFNDIADGVLGSVQVKGKFRVVQAAEVIGKGDGVWWDSDGDPVGGTAGTGAATSTQQAAADGFLLGRCVQVSANTDVDVIVELNGKVEVATIAGAAGTDTVIIDQIVSALRENGIVAGT